MAWSIPSWPSSHAVRREPCRRGRVSEAYTKKCRPASLAARSGAITVPTSTVASAPALQWVRIRIPSLMSRFPWRPIARHIVSASMAYASAAPRALPPAATACITRSIAAKRSCPVGRVRRRRSAALRRSVPRSSASARPYAAAAPIAGAPRTAIVSIARATSSTSRRSRIFSSFGRSRWSTSRTESPSSHTVLSSRGEPSTRTRRPASPSATERRQEAGELRGAYGPLHVPRQVLVVRDLLVHPRELPLEAGLLLVEVPDRVQELLLAEPPPGELLLRALEAVRHRIPLDAASPERRARIPSAPRLREARRAPNWETFPRVASSSRAKYRFRDWIWRSRSSTRFRRSRHFSCSSRARRTFPESIAPFPEGGRYLIVSLRFGGGLSPLSGSRRGPCTGGSPPGSGPGSRCPARSRRRRRRRTRARCGPPSRPRRPSRSS